MEGDRRGEGGEWMVGRGRWGDKRELTWMPTRQNLPMKLTKRNASCNAYVHFSLVLTRIKNKNRNFGDILKMNFFLQGPNSKLRCITWTETLLKSKYS